MLPPLAQPCPAGVQVSPASQYWQNVVLVLHLEYAVAFLLGYSSLGTGGLALQCMHAWLNNCGGQECGCACIEVGCLAF